MYMKSNERFGKKLQKAARAAMLGGALVASAAGGEKAQSLEKQALTPELSTLTSTDLINQTVADAQRLVDSFWNENEAKERITSTIFRGKRDRSTVEEDLEHRSRAAIPTIKECNDLFRDYPREILELIENTPVDEYGFFVAGDSQRLFLIQNMGSGKIRCEKSYFVTTSKEDWNNTLDSDGTSLGLQWVSAKRDGIFGEVISEKHKKELRAHFGPPVQTQKGPKLIVSSLDYAGNQHATVVTKALVLWDEVNGTKRGELIHGTNREDILGQRASGGCTRVSNIDIEDLFRYAKTSIFDHNGKMVERGTPVMIAAKGRTPRYEKSLSKEKVTHQELKWDFSWPK